MSERTTRNSGSNPWEWALGGEEGLVYCHQLGEGNYGTVHKIRNNTTGTVFARKLIYHISFDEKTGKKQPPQEAEAVSALFVEGRGDKYLVKVMPVHGWIKGHWYYYIDMELCDFNLAQYIYDREPTQFRQVHPGTIKRSASDVLDIVTQIVSGVAFIHQSGMVHRDLKPGNENIWKIADFGLMKDGTESKLLKTDRGLGTLGYKAPELALPDGSPKFYTNKVDVWGLGCIIYELSTRRQAFPTLEDLSVYCASHKKHYFPRARFPFHGTAADYLFSLIEQTLRISADERLPAKNLLSNLLLRTKFTDLEHGPYNLHDKMWLTCVEKDLRLVGDDVRYVRRLDANSLNSDTHLLYKISEERMIVRKMLNPFLRSSKTIKKQRKLLNEVLLVSNELERARYLVDILGQGKLTHNLVWYYLDLEACPLDLKAFIAGDGQFIGESNLWRIMLQITKAVNFVHKSGIIIRDLKPSRVLYSKRLGSNGWKLGDFSQVATRRPEFPEDVVKSPNPLQWTEGYRAPEVVTTLDNDVVLFNEKVDIWLLGCIFYELINGRTPFENDYGVADYAARPHRQLIQLPLCIATLTDMDKGRIENTIDEMFSVDPQKRPSAETLISEVFQRLVEFRVPLPAAMPNIKDP